MPAARGRQGRDGHRTFLSHTGTRWLRPLVVGSIEALDRFERVNFPRRSGVRPPLNSVDARRSMGLAMDGLEYKLILKVAAASACVAFAGESAKEPAVQVVSSSATPTTQMGRVGNK